MRVERGRRLVEDRDARALHQDFRKTKALTHALRVGPDAVVRTVGEAGSGRKITMAEALKARRDMVYAQHQIGWALERLCELSGARWLYDSDPLQEIRRDVMTILTHHAASRPAAYAPYGHTLLKGE